MKDRLSWAVDIVKHLSEDERLELADHILHGLKQMGSRDGKPTRQGEELYRKYANSREYVLTGISCNLMYIRLEGDKRDLSSFWLHPWGMPSLIFYRKGGGEICIVNQAIRLNDSHVYDIPASHPDYQGYPITAIPKVPTKGKTG